MPAWLSDNLIHLTYVIYLLAYVVRDILYLRLLTIVAVVLESLYFYLLPQTLWAPILWSVAFAAVNIYQVAALAHSRKPVRLSEDEERLHKTLFRSLTPRELQRLLARAEWREMPADTVVVEECAPATEMMVIVEGGVRVRAQGQDVAHLGPGRLVGEMGYLTGRDATAQVVTDQSTRIVAWRHSELKNFILKYPKLESALQVMIGSDLVAKLSRHPPQAA